MGWVGMERKKTEGFSLVQYNTNPTRLNKVLVLCNDHSSLNCDVIIGDNIFNSDYESLCIQFDHGKSYQNNHNTRNVYDFAKADWLLMIDRFCDFP